MKVIIYANIDGAGDGLAGNMYDAVKQKAITSLVHAGIEQLSMYHYKCIRQYLTGNTFPATKSTKSCAVTTCFDASEICILLFGLLGKMRGYNDIV